jgi:hypothetical protein
VKPFGAVLFDVRIIDYSRGATPGIFSHPCLLIYFTRHRIDIGGGRGRRHRAIEKQEPGERRGIILPGVFRSIKMPL